MTVRTHNGELQRPANKICPLLENAETEENSDSAEENNDESDKKATVNHNRTRLNLRSRMPNPIVLIMAMMAMLFIQMTNEFVNVTNFKENAYILRIWDVQMSFVQNGTCT